MEKSTDDLRSLLHSERQFFAQTPLLLIARIDGKKQITNTITSSILQGKSIKGIADELQTRIPDMNRASAIRTARTAITGAQNAGRMDSYRAAEKMGIKLKRNGWHLWTIGHATLTQYWTE